MDDEIKEVPSQQETLPDRMADSLDNMLADLPTRLLMTEQRTVPKDKRIPALGIAEEAETNLFIQEAARAAIKEALEREYARAHDYLHAGSNQPVFVVDPNVHLSDDVRRVGLAKVPPHPEQYFRQMGEFVRGCVSDISYLLRREGDPQIRTFDALDLEQNGRDLKLDLELTAALKKAIPEAGISNSRGVKTIALIPLEVSHVGGGGKTWKKEQHIGAFVVYNPHESLEEGLRKGLNDYPRLMEPDSYIARESTFVGLQRIPQSAVPK